MIGRKELPPEYEEWSLKWGAPYGHPAARNLAIKDRFAAEAPVDLGPFAFQISNHTRAFEYPWAYHRAEVTPGLRALDVGGGLGGLQFVLALEGCSVVNVDPEARLGRSSWSNYPSNAVPLTEENHKQLNEVFGTDVRLVPEKVQEAGIEDGTIDRAFCLSVLEHVGDEEAGEMLTAIARALAPGGRCLLTVDLFLDVRPFGVLTENVWGTNVDVHAMVEGTGLELVEGDPRELLGFPEFDFDRVVSLLPELLVGYYSALSQSLVLAKAAD